MNNIIKSCVVITAILFCCCEDFGDVMDCEAGYVVSQSTTFGFKQVIITFITFIVLMVFFNRRRIFHAKI